MTGLRLLSALVAATALITQGANAAHPNRPGYAKGYPRVANSSRVASDGKGGAQGPVLNIVPNAYIVELESDASSIEGRSLGGVRARFHKRAEEEDIDYTVRREFTDDSLFHGLSVQVEGEGAKAALESLPEVKRVWPVPRLSRPEPVGIPARKNVSISSGDGDGPAEGYSTEIIRGKDYKIDYNLKMAGVEHMHSHGFKGKGIKIAIIDTGVDYTHPALGGKFGPGNKIAFGRNYIDDDQGGPDDPISTCDIGGHGTHVAGIIGGQDPKDFGFGLLGVAPEATLGMYRVFGCGEGADGDVVLQALLDAYNDGAHIVSMSLGEENGFEDADPMNQVITKGKKRGVATIVAAGNEGYRGPIFTAMPATSKDAIAVASMDSARFPTTYKMKSNQGREEYRYSSLWPLEGEFPIYAPSEEDESNYPCSGEDDNTVPLDQYLEKAAADAAERGWEVSETLFMTRRCNPGYMLDFVEYWGFKGVVWWRNMEYPNPDWNNHPSPSADRFVLGLDHVDGPKLRKAILKDPVKFRAKFTDRRFLPVDNPSAGLTSNFSSIGNTWEQTAFKPLLAAPGHLILSSWPMESGGYATISGTSMATPFVSGCYALLKQAFPKMTVDEITNLLSTTAAPAKWWGDESITHSVSHQGAGMINAWKAYNSGVKFKEGAIVIGGTSKPVTKTITFTNTLGRSKTFDITHAPAGLMQRLPYADIDPIDSYSGFPSKAIYANVEFKTPTKVTLQAGETAKVTFIVKPPTGLDPDTIPQFSGYIRFVSGRDVYSVPYQGLTYDIKKASVLEYDSYPGMPPLPGIVTYGEEEGDPNWTFEGDMIEYSITEGGAPDLELWHRQPSYVIRVDLVAADTKFKPTVHGFDVKNKINTTTPELYVVDDFGGAESFLILYESFYDEPEWLGTPPWAGEMYDEEGEMIQTPVGDYRFLLRALPVKGDYWNPEDWQSWLSPIIRFVE